MALLNVTNNPARDPIRAVLASGRDDAVLAVITGVEGASYRPVGAIMTVLDETDRAGTLSSGCIESDIALHAMAVRETGAPKQLRYGRGSPFRDISLPCGGGLDILLLPHPDRQVLADLADRRAARQACTLKIDMTSGAMALAETGETGQDGALMRIRFLPDLRFLVFGKGPEASTFAALVQSAGYPNLLLSPDDETLEDGAAGGCETRHLVSLAVPEDVAADRWTAVVLFFHDHEWEPPILQNMLRSEAFYIGAQGSRRARYQRNLALADLGLTQDEIDRMHGPVGLIPSARDVGTLAVSVLAEILAEAQAMAAEPAAG